MLKYTKDKPTKFGWYWLKLSDYGEDEIVAVNPDGFAYFLGEWISVDQYIFKRSWWAGPINPPVFNYNMA